MKHYKPYDNTPSPFVVNCLKRIHGTGSNLSLDLGCGYGRHSTLLNAKGYDVVAADINLEALADPQLTSFKKICLDASKELPFANNIFGLIVIVHYVHSELLSKVVKLLEPGGYLIYETFGAHGGNWMSLPIKGCISSELKNTCEMIEYIEKKARSQKSELTKVTLKMCARKLS